MGRPRKAKALLWKPPRVQPGEPVSVLKVGSDGWLRPLKPEAPPDDRLLREPEVEKLVGLKRTTIWKLECEGQFPKRVKRSGSRGRAVAWSASEVARWIAERKAAREA